MRFILPVELGGLINSDHGKQESSSLFGEVYYQLDDTTKLTLDLDMMIMRLNISGSQYSR